MQFNLHVKSTEIKKNENKNFYSVHRQNDMTVLVSS